MGDALVQMPNVKTRLRDTDRNILYTVYAYRELTQAEMVQAVRHYLATQKKKPKPGTEVKIITIHGADL